MNGTYRGLEFIIHKNEFFDDYVAYIKLPDNHPWLFFLKQWRKAKFTDGKKVWYQRVRNYHKIKLDCFNKISFGKKVKKGDPTMSPGWWIGWDYAQAGNYVENAPMTHADGRKWTVSQIKSECKQVIRQVLKTKKI